MKSLYVIQNIPSPYRIHIFNEMWLQLKTLGIEFQVHFMSDMSRGHDERPLSWRNPKIDFPHRYWNDYGFSCHHFNPGMLFAMQRRKPDWLLIGSTFDTFTGLAASQLFGHSVKCAWSEGNTKTTGQLNGWKGWIKRRAFSGCRYVAVPGHDAVNYIQLHQHRADRKMPQPVFLPNLIDETRFKQRCAWSTDEIAAIRLALGVREDERLAITPARLDRSKGLVEYLSFLTPDILSAWKLLILGQGALKDQLIAIARKRGVGDKLIIKDYVSYADMPRYYAAADLFLLPSNRDPNPLSVVEALHSGLPVAVSEMAGNVDEAVTEARNGWVLPVKDSRRYPKVLKDVFSTPVERLREMGSHSKHENAEFWNTKKCIANFLTGIGIG